MRLVTPLAIFVLLAALLAGCGGSSSDEKSGGEAAEPAPARTSTAPIGASARSCDTYAVDAKSLRVTGIACGQGRRVMFGWQRDKRCAPAAGASRSACTSRSYRCVSARTNRGIAVSCSRPGESIAFVVKRG